MIVLWFTSLCSLNAVNTLWRMDGRTKWHQQLLSEPKKQSFITLMFSSWLPVTHLSVYVNLIRHKFIPFSMKVCHLGVNQYPNGMKTYHSIVESGGKNVSKKFSEQFYDGMWNNFFKICINSSAIDQKGWKSLFVWSILVWIYTILVWIHSTLV